MKKSEDKKVKKLTGKTVLICLFLILVFYISISFIINSGGSLTTYIAREGKVEESFIADGFIFKDQTVIKAPKDGYLECAVDEAGRVNKNGVVAYIYDNEVDATAKNRVAEIDEKIEAIQEDNRNISATENDAVRLEQDVLKAVSGLSVSVRDGNMKEINDARKTLDGVVESKRKISGDDPSGEDALKALQDEKDKLESKNDMNKTEVASSAAGSFTALTDGLESVLDDEKLENITQGYIEDIEIEEKEGSTGIKVKQGEAIGKIVDTYSWYFAAIIDKDTANTMKKGDAVQMKFLDSSDNTIDGNVYNITDEKGGRAVVVIKSSAYVDNLYSMSSAKVEVVRKSYEGIKIPAKSVRVKDGRKGVYVLSGKTAKFRDAKVYYIGEEWAVISREEKNGIKLYDEVVVNGSNIYEGKVVR